MITITFYKKKDDFFASTKNYFGVGIQEAIGLWLEEFPTAVFHYALNKN